MNGKERLAALLAFLRAGTEIPERLGLDQRRDDVVREVESASQPSGVSLRSLPGAMARDDLRVAVALLPDLSTPRDESF